MSDPMLAPFEEKLTQLVAWAKQRIPSYADKFQYPRIIWMEKPVARKIGTYSHSEMTIRLNQRYVFDGGQGAIDAMRQEVLPHEYAHHVTRVMFPHAKQAHGKEFKRVCVAMGIPPKATTKAFTGQKVHRRTGASCPCHTVTAVTYTIARRIEEGKKYRCKSCKGPISLTAQAIQAQPAN